MNLKARIDKIEQRLNTTYKPYIVPVKRGQSEAEAMQEQLKPHELEAIENYPADQLSVIFLVEATK